MENKTGGNGHKHKTGIEKVTSTGNDLALESIQTILDRRAARLARAPEQEKEGDRSKLVLVRLGGEIYALDTQVVYDIWPAQQITLVPRVPGWVLGVVNRRGRILSVVDLRAFLGLAEAAADRGSDGDGWDDDAADQTRYLILLQVPEMEVVLCVDDVLGVEALLDSRITERTGTVHGIPQEYVRGVSELDEEHDKALAVILDVCALLADERLIVHQEIV